MSDEQGPVVVDRVQLGRRMEARMVKVLEGLAEFEGATLGQLLEKIVLHSFEPKEGEEGEMAASPHSKRALAAIADLKRVYGMDFDMHPSRRFQGDGSIAEISQPQHPDPNRRTPRFRLGLYFVARVD